MRIPSLNFRDFFDQNIVNLIKENIERGQQMDGNRICRRERVGFYYWKNISMFRGLKTLDIVKYRQLVDGRQRFEEMIFTKSCSSFSMVKKSRQVGAMIWNTPFLIENKYKKGLISFSHKLDNHKFNPGKEVGLFKNKQGRLMYILINNTHNKFYVLDVVRREWSIRKRNNKNNKILISVISLDISLWKNQEYYTIEPLFMEEDLPENIFKIFLPLEFIEKRQIKVIVHKSRYFVFYFDSTMDLSASIDYLYFIDTQNDNKEVEKVEFVFEESDDKNSDFIFKLAYFLDTLH